MWKPQTATTAVPSSAAASVAAQSLTTPGGVSLNPVTIEDTLSEVPDNLAKEAMRESLTLVEPDHRDIMDRGFAISPDDMPKITAEGAISAGLKIDYEKAKDLEATRIEDVLTEVVPNYEGKDIAGPLGTDISMQDGLGRRRKFEQRERYYKKKFPEGRYFRQDVGGTSVEMYSPTPDGPIYRVSPDVYTLGDIGEVTGAVLNYTTAGSVVGSLFSPFWGTAGGAYLGATIDDFIADGGMDPDAFKTKLLSGDRATVALVDGLITKFLPGVGRVIKKSTTKMAGIDNEPTSILYELGLFSVSPNAVAAQKAATNLSITTGVPVQPLNVSQLSNSVVLRGIASQISGTSGKLPQQLSNQQNKVLLALETHLGKLGGDYSQLSQDELKNYIALTNKKLADNVFEAFRSRTGGAIGLDASDDIAKNIAANATKADNSYKQIIDTTYEKAFHSAETQNVRFDLSGVVNVAKEIQQGIQIGAQKKTTTTSTPSSLLDSTGKAMPSVKTTTRTGADTVRSRELQGELKSITDKLISIVDPNVTNQTVKSVSQSGRKETVSSFKQLKDLRDQVQDLMGRAEGSDLNSASKLLKSMDDLIVNGVENGAVTGGSDAWRTLYKEAGQLVKQRSDAKNFTSIGQIFSNQANITPQAVADRLLNGGLTDETFTILQNMVRTTAVTETEKKTADALIRNIKDSFVAQVIRDPENSVDLIVQMKKRDKALFNKLLDGDKNLISAMDDFVTTSQQLQSGPVYAALKDEQMNSSRAMTYVRSLYTTKADKGVQNFILANGGHTGQRAAQIRSSVFKDILDKSRVVDQGIGSNSQGKTTINPAILSSELNKLSNFSGAYEAFKPLFGVVKESGELVMDKAGQKYFDTVTDMSIYNAFLSNAPDVGGAFATGSIRSALLDPGGKLIAGGLRPLFTNSLMGKVLSATPSVAQLERATKIKSSARFINGATTLLNQITDSLNIEFKDGIPGTFGQTGSNLGPETSEEEIERTGGPLQTGTLPQQISSVAPTTPAPTQLASAPQIQPSPRASQGAGITNFSSLFPRDELGGAIANRRNQGIMGLA